MKKIIAALLSIVSIVTVFAVPVSAVTTKEAVISINMTEDEFRSYEFDENYSVQNVMNIQLGSNGNPDFNFYYNTLQTNYSNTFAYAAYNTAAANFSSFTSGSWEFTFSTDYFNGQYYNDYQESDFYKTLQAILKDSSIGVWCYRYDNILECDRFTSNVSGSMEFDFDYSNKIAKTYITLTCVDHTYYNAAEFAQCDAVIDSIAAVANTKPNQYEMLKYIHDTLILGAEYDYSALSASADSKVFFHGHSAMGVLTKGKGVCESYAKAFKEICDRLNFYTPVAVITSATHMWNIVKLNNKWYCLDATWDDFGGNKVDYTYFLCGDPDIVDGSSTDHVPDGRFPAPPTYANGKFNPSEKFTGWQMINGNYYYFKNGVVHSGWLYDAGNYYYLDASGCMATGWLLYKGDWYFLNSSGAMVTGWLNIGELWYYFDALGVMQTGKKTINGVQYYFDASGAMRTGWTNENGLWYYIDGAGNIKTGWANIGRVWYYFDASGIMQTGWEFINGVWYYFDASGAMQTGWKNLNGAWYFFDGSGAMKTGWANIGQTWYYFDGSGAMQTGWEFINGAWYYFNGGGAMQTGWLYNGAWYYLYDSGAMATNIYIAGGYIDASGVWR